MINKKKIYEHILPRQGKGKIHFQVVQNYHTCINNKCKYTIIIHVDCTHLVCGLRVVSINLNVELQILYFTGIVYLPEKKS